MKKLTTLGTIVVLICCVCVVANGKTDTETTKAMTTSVPVASSEAKRN